MKRYVLPLLAIPVLGALLYTFQRVDEGGTIVPAEAVALPRYTVYDAVLTRFDTDGSATLRGKASSVAYFDDESGHATDLQADMLADDEATWHLSSPTATMPARDRRILLEGPVVANGRWPDSGEDLTVGATQVWVDTDTHQFDSRQGVTLKSASRNGSAVGVRVDWQDRRMQLLHNVKMTYVTAP
jgi:LPS export ABC transporter protein LptC